MPRTQPSNRRRERSLPSEPNRSESSTAIGRAPIAKMSRRMPPTPVAAPWNGSTADGWLWLSTLKATARPSPTSITPAFSPGPCSTRGPSVGRRRSSSARVLVAAVLRPEQRVDGQLEGVRIASEVGGDPLELAIRETETAMQRKVGNGLHDACILREGVTVPVRSGRLSRRTAHNARTRPLLRSGHGEDVAQTEDRRQPAGPCAGRCRGRRGGRGTGRRGARRAAPRHQRRDRSSASAIAATGACCAAR